MENEQSSAVRSTKPKAKRDSRHDIRRLAMQVLYQIDVTGSARRDDILSSLDQERDSPKVRSQAVDLALLAWENKEIADKDITAFSGDWPTYRQPPVDRAIFRLAHYEITTQRVDRAVAIDEAVELAKNYASEDSPPFINGVLDKIAGKAIGDRL